MGVINKTTEKINTLLDKVEGFPMKDWLVKLLFLKLD